MEKVHSGCYGGGMIYVDKMAESEEVHWQHFDIMIYCFIKLFI
jgi:hypothetical protein